MDSGQRLCERPNVFFGSAVGSFESKLIKFDLYCNVQFNSIREPRCELMFLMLQVGSQICKAIFKMAASLIEFLACLRTNFEFFCLIFGISKSRKFYFS